MTRTKEQIDRETRNFVLGLLIIAVIMTLLCGDVNPITSSPLATPAATTDVGEIMARCRVSPAACPEKHVLPRWMTGQ